MYINNKKILTVFEKILITALIIFSIFIVSIKDKNRETILSSSQQINNKKICWGIKRGINNEQPDVGKKNKKILEENGGISLGNANEKNVYLTFDEGYEAGYTSEILQILKQNNVKATFFITAHYLNTQTELVGKIIEEGHIIGNHTVNHKSMPGLTEIENEKEIMELHKTIYEKFNYEMKYLRPPMGEFSEKTLSQIKSLGYKTVMWSFAYEDWNEKQQPDEKQAKEKILNNIHNGEIMLLHGNSKTNLNILDEMIKKIKECGYEFKSLDEFKL